ncbi:ankyrin repeat domain-containing protein [Candidatus Phycorickettsia trachydisci]|nr:ankyrin repeat domain-containing protein [Candidatus Phycorickettsia trachydisci]
MGQNPNARSDGSTALRMAARQGNIEMLKLLLDRGAIVNTENCTLLHAAAESIKDQEIEAEQNDGWQVMKYLIQHYPLDPYGRNQTGLTPQDILVQIDWSFEDYYSKLVDEWRNQKDASLSGEF